MSTSPDEWLVNIRSSWYILGKITPDEQQQLQLILHRDTADWKVSKMTI